MSSHSRVRRWRRVMTTLGLTAVTLVFGAGIALAHVTVNPSSVAAGGYSKLTFRVPNESPTAGTVSLTVTLPADHPFASVSVRQQPGWTAVPTKTTLPAPVTEGNTTIKEAVTTITWTADAGVQIAPGEFAEFDISVGPVPDVESLSFPATQTYSDGKVVEWNEPTPVSGEEPEHPAPTLTVTEATDGDHHDAGASSSEAAPTTSASVTAAAATDSGSSSSSTATILAVISIVIAAAALLVAAIALRKRPAPANDHREG